MKRQAAMPVLRQFKITRTLDRRLITRAAQLGVTPTDCLRFILIQALGDDSTASPSQPVIPHQSKQGVRNDATPSA